MSQNIMDNCEKREKADKCIPIIGGWYTSDYAPLYDRVMSDISSLNFLTDFIQVNDGAVSKYPWEKITCLKPFYAKQILNRINGTLLLVDVDARFRGTREEIIDVCNINADIALRLSANVSRSGRIKMHPWSGTMVLRPTDNTMRLLDAWDDAASGLGKHLTDEVALSLALTRVPGLTVSMLHSRACGGAGEVNPIILHPHRTGKRMGKLQKFINSWNPFN